MSENVRERRNLFPVGAGDATYWKPILELKSTFDDAVNNGGVSPCTSITGRSQSKRSGGAE